MMRKLFTKTIEVLGIERFMRIIPFPEGMESIGILVSKEDSEGLERGDVIIGVKDEGS